MLSAAHDVFCMAAHLRSQPFCCWNPRLLLPLSLYDILLLGVEGPCADLSIKSLFTSNNPDVYFDAGRSSLTYVKTSISKLLELCLPFAACPAVLPAETA